MSDIKFSRNQENVLSTIDFTRNIQIGVVCSIDDPKGLGRIKVKIPGNSTTLGDGETPISELPWCYPLTSKFLMTVPKVNETVFVFIFNKQNAYQDRLYLGPIISTLDKLNYDPSITSLSSFSFGQIGPNVDINRIPALKGVFPSNDDVSIQGRYNTDLTFKNNEFVIRAGKFEASNPNDNNPYPFQFNISTQGYFNIRNNVPISNNTTQNGSVANIVANKINLITHKDGNPRFNVTNQDNLVSNDEILNIIQNAHPLPFGDILIQYLRLLKNAFINHVHNNNGTQPTDLVVGGLTQDVREFKKQADGLENQMLSNNIRIN